MKLNKIIFTALYLFITHLSIAQSLEWVKQIEGGVSGEHISLDASGNIYTVGRFWDTISFGSASALPDLIPVFGQDIYIAKQQPDNDFLWVKHLKGYLRLTLSSMDVDDAGNIFLTGSFNGTIGIDAPNTHTL